MKCLQCGLHRELKPNGLCTFCSTDDSWKNPITSMGDYWCKICGCSYGHMTKPKGKCPNCGSEQ